MDAFSPVLKTLIACFTKLIPNSLSVYIFVISPLNRGYYHWTMIISSIISLFIFISLNFINMQFQMTNQTDFHTDNFLRATIYPKASKNNGFYCNHSGKRILCRTAGISIAFQKFRKKCSYCGAFFTSTANLSSSRFFSPSDPAK